MIGWFPCPRGEMDITTVFGTVVVGSSPAGGTRAKRFAPPEPRPVDGVSGLENLARFFGGLVRAKNLQGVLKP